jgi:hypothetical protein
MLDDVGENQELYGWLVHTRRMDLDLRLHYNIIYANFIHDNTKTREKQSTSTKLLVV